MAETGGGANERQRVLQAMLGHDSYISPCGHIVGGSLPAHFLQTSSMCPPGVLLS